MKIDLILVEENNVKTLSCGIAREGNGADQLLGPVPYANGVVVLARLLHETLPGRYTLKEAQTLLAGVHMRNIARHVNATGMSYPHRARG